MGYRIMMPATEPRGVLGDRWRACRRVLLTLGIGAGYLVILCVLAWLPFLWDVQPRDLPNWTVPLAGLALLTAAGSLTWRTLRSLARSQYRFRLRTLLAGMVVVCLLSAVVANRLHSASRDWEAQQLLGAAGGYAISFVYSSDESWYCRLTALLGLDAFQRITSLQLETDQAVEVLAGHPREFADVRRITLGEVTDRGLEHLANSTPLRNLLGIEFRGSLVTGDGLKCLAAGDRLKRLLINGCSQLTDAGMAHLNELSSLDGLCVWEDAGKMRLTDASLAHLAKLPRLRHLALSGRFSDVGLEHLQNLKPLQWLELEKSNITDSGLTHLQGFASLETLVISRATISDVGLVHLRRLVRLKHLSVSGAQVTREGIESLRAALPDCRINEDWAFLPLRFALAAEPSAE